MKCSPPKKATVVRSVATILCRAKKNATRKFDFLLNSFYFSTFLHSTLSERSVVRVLSRQYALTSMGYKYLEIDINVGPPSYVKIAIGDHRGNELMSLKTWKGLYEQRLNVLNLLRTDYKDLYNFINVVPLTARICVISDVNFIRLESQNVRMIMTESTVRRMFDLDGCVDLMFDRLIKITDNVDMQFTQFSNIASTIMNPDQVTNAIRASNIFNKHRLLDCELLALVFST
ncbi:uncharacterized protein LOC114254587 [Monomorium pharaonis]|uniref:uncharacterized protein LOC114254587 n=1 Tax=Monomorium pharaonis TaxID=307658 RepID=UPI00102E1805|nr:uncharacterized protein LOC114254587 [Monomorium pharaonis]